MSSFFPRHIIESHVSDLAEDGHCVRTEASKISSPEVRLAQAASQPYDIAWAARLVMQECRAFG